MTILLLKIVGALALLMFGMKTMSDALQKMAGPQLRHVLGTMTTNRVTGILTGTFITSAVQSSTATTVMTVSFVNAGLLTLGIGTHLDPEVAVFRALTEVAQSRATQINGAREDTVRADFAREAGYERMKRINRYYFREEENKVDFKNIENRSTTSISEDLKIVSKELADNEIKHILYADLTRPELDVSVVRVIIPEMELYAIDPSRAGYRFLRV